MQQKNVSYLLPIITHDFHAARRFIVDLFETQFLVEMLTRFGGQVSLAARASGLTQEKFEELARKHHVDVSQFLP